jgi:uncharacterized membrane protein YccC
LRAGLASLAAYWLADHILSAVPDVSAADDALGGLWAVIATIFAFRDSYQQSISAAASRMSATSVSFILCLIYLLFLPFHAWALALLIGLSALTVTVAGRPGDAPTAGITTAIIMVVASLSPHDAWKQPILRFADTVVGIAIGLGAAWIGLPVIRPRISGPGS